jgi:hypothetical protein
MYTSNHPVFEHTKDPRCICIESGEHERQPAYTYSSSFAGTGAAFFPRNFFGGVGFGSFVAARRADVRAIASYRQSCQRPVDAVHTGEWKGDGGGEKDVIANFVSHRWALPPNGADSAGEMRPAGLDRSRPAGCLVSQGTSTPSLHVARGPFQWVLVACGV